MAKSDDFHIFLQSLGAGVEELILHPLPNFPGRKLTPMDVFISANRMSASNPDGLVMYCDASLVDPGLISRETGLPTILAEKGRTFAADAFECIATNDFIVGIIGGVGPAATTDLMNKIFAATGGKRDQDHLRMRIEHNPGIPDRTRHLVFGEETPEVSLLAAARRLEKANCSIIALPCNTAHAYLPAMQPLLSVPVLDMPALTAGYCKKVVGDGRQVGILATSGTLSVGLYQKALQAVGLVPLVPPDEAQKLVMESIYGPKGVKSGFTDGECRDQLAKAMQQMASEGAESLILGCTELPLIAKELTPARPDGSIIPMIDPTDVLARECVLRSRRQGTAGATGIAC